LVRDRDNRGDSQDVEAVGRDIASRRRIAAHIEGLFGVHEDPITAMGALASRWALDAHAGVFDTSDDLS